MFKKIQIILFFITLAFFGGGWLSPRPASASSMSNYMGSILTQVQNLSPNAFEGQKRGFFVGGSMVIPPQSTTINPISFTPPSLSVNGCGAINLTMGGFSYMNPQYLMQKLQAIMQEAPSFALEIAIKVLSEQAGSVMNFLEHMSDFINSLNVNSCGTMQPIAMAAANDINSHLATIEGNGASAQANGGGSWFGGVTSQFNTAKAAFENMWQNTAPASGQRLIAFQNENCPVAPGSNGLLRTAADQMQMGELPSDFIDFIRAYVGDVVPEGSQTNSSGCSIDVKYLPPTGPAATSKAMSAIATGGYIYEISEASLAAGDQPTRVTLSSSLQNQVKIILNGIINSLNPNFNPSGTQAGTLQEGIALVDESQIPLYPFLKDAVLSNSPGVAQAIIDNISGPIALNIAYTMLGNFIHQAVITLNYEKTEIKKGEFASADLKGPLGIKELLKKLHAFNTALYRAYSIEMKKDALANGSFVSQYAQYQAELNARMKNSGIIDRFSRFNTIP